MSSPFPDPAADQPARPPLIRREGPGDAAAIDEVHTAAFGALAAAGSGAAEVALVHALRRDAGWIPQLALVAEDGAGTVVGHVVCTRGSLPVGSAVGLGPIGVHPAHQGNGVGSALMHAALGAADALDFDVVVLVGHLDYYPRFGFVPARRLGITSTDASWGDHFQARALSRWTADVGGEFRYAAPFSAI